MSFRFYDILKDLFLDVETYLSYTTRKYIMHPRKNNLHFKNRSLELYSTFICESLQAGLLDGTC